MGSSSTMIPMLTVGSVPYVNARPLVHWFEALGTASPIQVRYAVPSQLPALLNAGEITAALVSSIESFGPGPRQVADGICIASDGPVESVRLFSKVPFEAIETLVLDQSSLTSNRLAQILLAELHGVRPELVTHQPNLHSMLEHADACVLIGDIGMSTDGAGLHVMDLGEAWTQHTGLPFVWALWVGIGAMTVELSTLLNAARLMSFVGRNPGQGMQSLRRQLMLETVRTYDPHYETDPIKQKDAVVNDAADRSGWDRADAHRYLTETIVYDLSPRALEGLNLFRTKLLEHELLAVAEMPELVEPQLHISAR